MNSAEYIVCLFIIKDHILYPFDSVDLRLLLCASDWTHKKSKISSSRQADK